MPVTWYAGIDWDKDGAYTNETGRLTKVSIKRGRDETVGADSYDRVKPGECILTLDNYDGRYDPYNTASPLTGTILPDRPVRVQETVGGVTRNLFTGRLRDIRPQSKRSEVQLICRDGLEIMAEQKCDNGALKTNYKVSDAIQALLEAAGYPYGLTELEFPFVFPGLLGSCQIEDNGDTMPYWWSDHTISVLEAIWQLSQAFAGDYYVDTSGVFVYNARSYEGGQLFAITQNKLLRDIELTQPWDEIRNVIRITGYPRATAAAVELWRLSDVPSIAAGATITIWAEYQHDGDPCPATAVTTPAATTDYTANTLANGSGVNKTANVAVTMTAYATEAKLEIKNNDAGLVYLTLMKLRGTSLAALSASTYAASDATSIAAYGRSGLSISSQWLQETIVMQYHGDWAKLLFASPRKSLRVRLEEQTNYQFSVDLFNQIGVSINKLGIDGTYIVDKIEHEWSSGQGVVTTLRLEPYPGDLISNLWVFTATFGDVLGW